MTLFTTEYIHHRTSEELALLWPFKKTVSAKERLKLELAAQRLGFRLVTLTRETTIPETLKSSADAGSPRASNWTGGLVTAAKPEVISKAVELQAEVLYYLLHLCDRHAFKRFGAAKRHVFMETLLEESSRLFLTPQLENGGFSLSVFQSSYNSRQRHYAQFKRLFPTDGTPPYSGTLCWEFAMGLGLVYTHNANPIKIHLVALDAIKLLDTIDSAWRDLGDL